MASLIKRADSPYWWVGFRDSLGKRKMESTGKLRATEEGTRAARRIEAEKTALEYSEQVTEVGPRWESWAPDFLKRHAAGLTYVRYEGSWRMLIRYLREAKIYAPQDLTYHHVIAYPAWRMNRIRRSGKSACLNTAVTDLRVLSLVCQQAVRLSYSKSNPCDKHGIKKTAAKEKRELTDAELQAIWAEIQKPQYPLWMSRAFTVAVHTGCRLRETQIPITSIDMGRGSMTFLPKGGRGKIFAVSIPDALRPLFQRLIESGEEIVCEIPHMASKQWGEMLVAAGVKNACFHCLRVTYITRLARAEVPRSIAMRLVNHSSSLVHGVYQKLGVEDVRAWANKVPLPHLADAASPMT